jgi:hypothetical protein
MNQNEMKKKISLCLLLFFLFNIAIRQATKRIFK